MEEYNGFFSLIVDIVGEVGTSNDLNDALNGKWTSTITFDDEDSKEDHFDEYEIVE